MALRSMFIWVFIFFEHSWRVAELSYKNILGPASILAQHNNFIKASIDQFLDAKILRIVPNLSFILFFPVLAWTLLIIIVST